MTLLTFNRSTFLFLLVISSFFVTSVGYADEFGDRIFQFQKKLAERGNTFAEYKLGTLYEFGVSVDSNTEKAISWYNKAAAKDYLPAINRLTYLDIKKNGFRKKSHTPWLKGLVKQAQSAEPNAMIILGQMYHNGLHLQKNLNKAFYFLDYASSLGHTEVDAEIKQIKQSLAASGTSDNKPAPQKTKSQIAPKSTVAKKKVVQKKKQAKVAKKKETDEERRRKYEQAMKLLEEETLLLEQQQKWAESK